MNDIERQLLPFGVAILDGEPDAHRILADFLEELGEPKQAEWARGKKSRQKRLEFVVALLPASTAMAVGCDFLKHVDDSPEYTILETRELASAGRDADFGNIEALLERLETPRGDGGQGRWNARHNYDRRMNAARSDLGAALRAFSTACSHERRDDHRLARHHANQTRDALRRLSRHAREAAQWLLEHNGYPTRIRSYANMIRELQWQIKHTKTVIETLLTPNRASP